VVTLEHLNTLQDIPWKNYYKVHHSLPFSF